MAGGRGWRSAYMAADDNTAALRLLEGNLCPGTALEPASAACTGRVTARRRHGALTFCIVELGVSAAYNEAGTRSSSSGGATAQVQLVLQRAGFETDEQFKVATGVARVGSTVGCTGVPSCDRASELSLYVTELRLLKCDPVAASVSRVVELTLTGMLPRAGAATALCCDLHGVDELVRLTSAARGGCSDTSSQQNRESSPVRKKQKQKQHKYDLKQAVLRCARCLQGLPPTRLARQRVPRISSVDSALLAQVETATQQHCWPVSAGALDVAGGKPTEAVAAALAQQLDPSSSLHDPCACCCRGAGSRGEWLHGKKQPQVEWMITELQAMVLTSHAAGCPVIRIVDVGGGRGDLALCVARTLPSVHVVVVDVNGLSLAAGAARARVSGLTNVDFVCADASKLATVIASADMLIGLHACGGLTDLLLHMAATHAPATDSGRRRGASQFLVAPCCFNKHPHLVSPQCNWARRCSASERAALFRLAESKERSTSWRAMLIINRLRLSAVLDTMATMRSEDGGTLELRLLQFSDDFSLRNLVLQGVLRSSRT